MEILAKDIRPEGIPVNNREGTVWVGEQLLDSSRKYLLRGTSGRGKSTFMHILGGIRKNFSGTLLLDGMDTSSHSPDKWAKLRSGPMGIVFQDLRLLPQLTARENLSIKTALHEPPEAPEIENLADRLDIQEHLDKPCRKLSFGQQQRLAILRALLQPFQFLMLDEPFSHLDPQNTKVALETILETANQRKAGILLTTLHEDYGFPFDKELTV